MGMGEDLRDTASTYGPLPRRAEDVTPEWVTAALHSQGRDVVVKALRHPLGEGVGMVSGLEILGSTTSGATARARWC